MAEQTVGKVEQLTTADNIKPSRVGAQVYSDARDNIARQHIQDLQRQLDGYGARIAALEIGRTGDPLAGDDSERVTVDGVRMTEAQREAIVNGFAVLHLAVDYGADERDVASYIDAAQHAFAIAFGELSIQAVEKATEIEANL